MAGTAEGWTIIILALLIGIAVMVFILMWMKSQRLRIRDPLSSKNYITDYWVIETKDKRSGVMYWKSVFWQQRIKTPIPPPQALEVGKRGKKFAEAYRITEDEFIWITDKGLRIEDVIDEKTGRKKKIIYDVQKDGKLKMVDTFKPFSVVQRETIVSQFAKAQEIRNKKWTADKIVAMTSIGGLIILIVALMIFWGDMAKPILDLHSSMADREKRIMAMEERIMNLGCGNIISTPTQQQSNLIVSDKPPTK